MRKLSIVLLILIISVPVFSQNLSNVEDDFEIFLRGLGDDLFAHTTQNALFGDGIATAKLSEGGRVMFTLGSIFADGIFTNTDDTNLYNALNASSLLNSLSSSSPTIGSILDSFSDFMPIPSMRLTIGINLGDADLLIYGSAWPEGLTDAIAGAAGISGIDLNYFNVVARLRFALIDEEAFDLSIGGGYILNRFTLRYEIPSFSQSLGAQTINISGPFSLVQNLHAFGVDIEMSADLGGFIPFARISSYYQISDYTGESSDGIAISGDLTSTLRPSVTVHDHRMMLLVSTGFELDLGGFMMYLGTSLDVTLFTPSATIGLGAKL
jgi:hypothetical protein